MTNFRFIRLNALGKMGGGPKKQPPPTLVTPPTVSGLMKIGQTLTAVPAVWSAAKAVTVTRSWEYGPSPSGPWLTIPGESALTSVIGVGMMGMYLSYVERAMTPGAPFPSVARAVTLEPVTPILSAIATAGWRASFPGVPAGPGLNVAVDIVRRGFSSTGEAVFLPDRVYVTYRVRNPWPNQGVLTTDGVALSEYIYQGDEVPGAVNNSTVVSPQPMVRWMMPDRDIVGNNLWAAIAAIHRDADAGQQIVCAKFIVTHLASGNTATGIVSAPALSAYTGWARQVPEFGTGIDISALPDGPIRLDVEVYPRFGTAASVYKSADAPVDVYWRARSIYFRKDVAKAVSPPIAVVNPGAAKTVRGVEYGAGAAASTGGVVSTNPAAARAAPFQSFDVALGALVLAANSGVTGQEPSGCEIWIAGPIETTNSFDTGTNRNSDGFALRIRKDPHLTGDETLISNLAGRTRLINTVWNPNLDAGKLHLHDLKYQTTTGGYAGLGLTATVGQGRLDVALINCEGDFAGRGGWMGGTVNGRSFHFYGGSLNNNNGGDVLTPRDNSGAGGHTACYGLSSTYGGVSQANLDIKTLIGCDFSGYNRGSAVASRESMSHVFVYYNKFMRSMLANSAIFVGDGTPLQSHYGLVGNLVERNGLADRMVRISGDSGTNSTYHTVLHNNTFAGPYSIQEGAAGMNNFYDETPGTLRSHVLVSQKGNIVTTQPTKGDTFVDNGDNIGNWPYAYGVGTADNFVTGTTGFNKTFRGLRIQDTGNRQLAGFVDFQCGSDEAGNGPGGGNYHLTGASPCKGVVPRRVTSHDLDGLVRVAGADSIGAYS